MTEPYDPVFDSLIPELRDWNDGAGIDPESWVGCVGNAELAIGYSFVFWPEFVRVGNYVVRKGLDDTDYLAGWAEQCEGNKAAVERLVNHMHIVDIHAYGTCGTEVQVRYLGRILKKIHEVKLKSDFPDLNFEVYFNDEATLDLHDYHLTFWQVD